MLLYKSSVAMVREGFLSNPLNRPAKVASQDVRQCMSVALYLEKERILVIEPLREELSHFMFHKGRKAHSFAITPLAKLLAHKRFVRHSSGNRQAWLQNCMILFGDYGNDNKCFKNALTISLTAVNKKADFERRWAEGAGNEFSIKSAH